MRFAQVHFHRRKPRARRHYEFHFRGCVKENGKITAARSRGGPSTGQRGLVYEYGLPGIAAHAIPASGVGYRGFPAPPHDRAGHARLAGVAMPVGVQIFVHVSRGAGGTQHPHRERVLDARAEDPGHAAAGRTKDRIALRIDLERKAVRQGNRESGSHDRAVLAAKPAHAL